jgi:toxin HigB-1
VIKSFKDKTTEAVFNDEMRKGFPADLFKVTRRKLMLLDAAEALDDVKALPGNRLEALKGNPAGQHFHPDQRPIPGLLWTLEGPKDVEIVDYH